MKKLLLLSALLVVNCALYAQFSVNSSGNSNVPSGKSFYIGNFGDNNYRMRFFNNSAYSIIDYQPDLIFRSAPTGSGSYPSRVIFKTNGFVGINNASPSYTLDVNGNIRGASFITSSDARLKKDLTSLDNVLSKINSLKGVKYYYNSDVKISRISPIDGDAYEESIVDVDPRRERVGLIAQEVQKVFPELVYEDENGFLGVDYVSLIPVLIEAVKAQQVQINILKKSISE